MLALRTIQAVALWVGLGFSPVVFGTASPRTFLQEAGQENSSSTTQNGMSRESSLAGWIENPILRDYFRQMFLRAPRQDMINDEFVEAIIDNQVDQFLKATDLQLQELVAEAEVARNLQHRREAHNDPAGPDQLDKALQASLKRLVDRCDGLGDRLGPIFLGLARQPKKATAPSKPKTFDEELDEVVDLVRDADRQIRDYLFNGTNLVHLNDLAENNMLIRLSEAEKLARNLEKRLQ